MKVYKISLQPQSAITSIPSSDTTFGAICWGIRILYGESRLKEILSRFISNDPPFILSSSFPVSVSGTVFLPKPKLKRLNPETIRVTAKERCKNDERKEAMFDVMSKYRRFSKFSYLSQSLFNSVLEGSTTEKTLLEDYIDGRVIEKSGFLLKKEEDDVPEGEFIQDQIRVRTRIDRLSGSTAGEGEMFHDEVKLIRRNYSLFFLLKTNEIGFLYPLLGRDKFLSDHGIGGDRNIGLNQFKLSVDEVDLKSVGEGKRFVTLSRYVPSPGEIDTNGDEICYDVVPWVSRVDNSLDFQGKRFIKDRVFYMKEGSTFKAKEKKEFYGTLLEVCNIDGIPIYQNGFAFPWFFNS